MKTPKEQQFEQKVQKLARESKILKQQMPLESRIERLEDLVTNICDVLLKISLVPR